jgi:hypothetical protein
MLGYLMLWIVTLIISVASVPLVIWVIRSSEWQDFPLPPIIRWRLTPLLLAPVLVSLVGWSTVRNSGGWAGQPPSEYEVFLMVAFLVASSVYVLASGSTSASGGSVPPNKRIQPTV